MNHATALATALDELAPTALAGDWDNVGLLLEGDRAVRRALVTIDLTPAVAEEAFAQDVDLVIAYHPTLFRPVRRLTTATAIGSTLLQLARRGVHLYSPHSALDAVRGGINDWLLEAFRLVSPAQPIQPDARRPDEGAGRYAMIAPVSAMDALGAIKQHLSLQQLRVAGPLDHTVRSVAVCPGAGAGVFAGVTQSVDLLLTGELGHHDVLAWAARGTTVVLTEHTNSERGYLPRYARRVAAHLGIEVHVAKRDADPLTLR